MDHLEHSIVGLERALMINDKIVYHLIGELAEAKKKLKDETVPMSEKTFLKAKIPHLEAEIKEKKKKIRGLLEDDYCELDHHSQWYLMGASIASK